MPAENYMITCWTQECTPIHTQVLRVLGRWVRLCRGARLHGSHGQMGGEVRGLVTKRVDLTRDAR
jgi:hypothetical protein